MRRCIHGAAAAAALSTAAFTTPAAAITLTDGVLAFELFSGQLNGISLGGTAVDTSNYVQQSYLNGGSLLLDVPPVLIDGASATNTGTSGDFAITQQVSILPFAGLATARVIEEVYVLTNTGNEAAAADIVSYWDQDLNDTGPDDTVTGAPELVYATDAVAPLLLALAVAGDGTTHWGAAQLAGLDKLAAALPDNIGAVGPLDTELAVGKDVGLVAVGESVTIAFRYLVSTDPGALPSFDPFHQAGTDVPLPAAAPLLLAGLAGVAALRRRA